MGPTRRPRRRPLLTVRRSLLLCRLPTSSSPLTRRSSTLSTRPPWPSCLPPTPRTRRHSTRPRRSPRRSSLPSSLATRLPTPPLRPPLPSLWPKPTRRLLPRLQGSTSATLPSRPPLMLLPSRRPVPPPLRSLPRLPRRPTRHSRRVPWRLPRRRALPTRSPPRLTRPPTRRSRSAPLTAPSVRLLMASATRLHQRVHSWATTLYLAPTRSPLSRRMQVSPGLVLNHLSHHRSAHQHMLSASLPLPHARLTRSAMKRSRRAASMGPSTLAVPRVPVRVLSTSGLLCNPTAATPRPLASVTTSPCSRCKSTTCLSTSTPVPLVASRPTVVLVLSAT